MIYVLLTLVLGVLSVIAVGVWRLTDAVNDLNLQVDKLRLSGRTVQRQAVMRDGALTEERELTRLARSTKSRRVVVGGDEESDLHASLSRGVGARADD